MSKKKGQGQEPTPSPDVPPEGTAASPRRLDDDPPPSGQGQGVATGQLRNPLDGLTEGRIVHYVVAIDGGITVHRPAIVTAVKDKKRGVIDLCYFTATADWPQRTHPGACVPLSDVPHEDGDTTRTGTWHFPERVG